MIFFYCLSTSCCPHLIISIDSLNLLVSPISGLSFSKTNNKSSYFQDESKGSSGSLNNITWRFPNTETPLINFTKPVFADLSNQLIGQMKPRNQRRPLNKNPDPFLTKEVTFTQIIDRHPKQTPRPSVSSQSQIKEDNWRLLR